MVEGPDDEEIYCELFWDHRDRVEFFRAGSRGAVERLLSELSNDGALSRCFGIVDRDFRTDEEVEKAWEALPQTHLLVLVRYAMENYLLEPDAVYEELRFYQGKGCPIPDAAAMERELHELCLGLRRAMAANWVLLCAGREFFAIGDARVQDEALVTRETARRLDCSEDEARARILEKEREFGNAFESLAGAHAYVNGKHLLHQLFHRRIVPVGRLLQKSDFLKRLAREARRNTGLHPHLKHILDLLDVQTQPTSAAPPGSDS